VVVGVGAVEVGVGHIGVQGVGISISSMRGWAGELRLGEEGEEAREGGVQ
jgi:hypothetical protein